MWNEIVRVKRNSLRNKAKRQEDLYYPDFLKTLPTGSKNTERIALLNTYSQILWVSFSCWLSRRKSTLGPNRHPFRQDWEASWSTHGLKRGIILDVTYLGVADDFRECAILQQVTVSAHQPPSSHAFTFGFKQTTLLTSIELCE